MVEGTQSWIRLTFLIWAHEAEILDLMGQLGKFERALTVWLVGWLKRATKSGPQ